MNSWFKVLTLRDFQIEGILNGYSRQSYNAFVHVRKFKVSKKYKQKSVFLAHGAVNKIKCGVDSDSSSVLLS